MTLWTTFGGGVIAGYVALIKPRIGVMVLVTTTLGFFLGGDGVHPIPLLLWTLVGTGLVGSGASALNNYLERDADAKMERTRRDVAESSGGAALAKTHEIPAHLYHGKIKQTGDRNYWLDDKNRNKHTSTRVDTYGRSRRGKG